MLLKKLINICLIVLMPSYLFAARPLSTEDAGVADQGSFETEFGYEYSKDKFKKSLCRKCQKDEEAIK